MGKIFFIFHILWKYDQKHKLICPSFRKQVSADPYLFVRDLRVVRSSRSLIASWWSLHKCVQNYWITFEDCDIVTNEINCTFHDGFSHKGPLHRVVGPLDHYSVLNWIKKSKLDFFKTYGVNYLTLLGKILVKDLHVWLCPHTWCVSCFLVLVHTLVFHGYDRSSR